MSAAFSNNHYLSFYSAEQVREGLDAVTGPSRGIAYKDPTILPRTNADVQEITCAVGFMCECTQDTALQGFPATKVH